MPSLTGVRGDIADLRRYTSTRSSNQIFCTLLGQGRCHMDVNADGEDTLSERAEVHFLAALVDEIMRKMMVAGVLSQADLNEVEQAAAKRVGSVPRAW